jgi:hypothetical protein
MVFALDLLLQPFRFFLIPVDEQQLGPVGGVQHGRLPPDPAGGTRDHHQLPMNILGFFLGDGFVVLQHGQDVRPFILFEIWIHIRYPSSKFFMHELTIRFPKPRDVVKDIAPQVVVIALLYDFPNGVQGDPACTIDRGIGILLETQAHLPLDEYDVPVLGGMLYIHLQAIRACDQPLRHGFEFDYAVYFLDAVAKIDVIVVIGQYMRPVGLALSVVDVRP